MTPLRPSRQFDEDVSRLGFLSHHGKGIGEMGRSPWPGVIESDAFLKFNDGGFKHSLLHQCARKVVVKSRVRWAHLDGPPKEFNRQVVLAGIKRHPGNTPNR